MYSKLLQKCVFGFVLILIFVGVFIYLADSYMELPSENWSKDEKLFSIKANTEYDDFFTKRLEYFIFKDQVHVAYVEDQSIKYRTLNKAFESEIATVLLKTTKQVDEMFIEAYDDHIELVVVSEETVFFYSFDKDLKQIGETKSIVVKNQKYDISNGHLIIREKDTFKCVSTRGEVILELTSRPYDIQTFMTYDGNYTLYYTSTVNSVPYINRAELTSEGELIDDVVITPVLTGELRLKILDMIVSHEANQEAIVLNIKDEKALQSYLNYYLIEEGQLILAEYYDRFQDRVSLITPTKLLVSMKGPEIAYYIGKEYYDFYNVVLFDLTADEEHAFKPLTKTKRGPSHYVYLQGVDQNYLVWGELKKGEMTMKVASDDVDLIKKSQKYNLYRFMELFYETIGAFMRIPTFILIIGVSTFAISMLLIVPGYMIFLSFFEKHQTKILMILVVIHNLGKLVIHFKFLERYALPDFLATWFIPIVLLTNILAIYNYLVINHYKHFDNSLTAYIPFFITDILLHTFIFGPFILMKL